MSKQRLLRVGTRESVLARLQTDLALSGLKECFPEAGFEIVPVKTSGDKIQDRPLFHFGGAGVFVKELEECLLSGEVDFVVHSLKDLPTVLPEGLLLGATLNRADPRDVLVTNYESLGLLPPGARVATSSRRREAQLKALRPDLVVVDIRGNIQTRMRKHDEGACDAMVLAAAGLLRLGLEGRIKEYFSKELLTPAAGQGALALECRADDEPTRAMLAKACEMDVWQAVTAERAFLARLGGGCSVPAGALAQVAGDRLELTVAIASLDGSRVFRRTEAGPASSGFELGSRLAEKLLDEGAGAVIEELVARPSHVWPP